MNNEVEIFYKYDKNVNKIKFFGEIFVENNKQNCILIINDKILELCEYYEIEENKNKNIKIILIEKNEIVDMSYMFHKCISLLSIVNLSKWKAINVNNTSYMFYGCSSLIDLSEFSSLITDKVKDISYMFFGCICLKYLPDINNWNLKNVKNKENILANINEKAREKYYYKLRKFMNNEMELIYQSNENNNDDYINLFGKSFVKNNKNNCLLIIKNKLYNFSDKYYYNIQDSKLDDFLIVKLIEKNNIVDMSYMFYGCQNLISITNIANWDTINATNMKSMFYLCKNLQSLGNLSKLRVDNVTDFSYMFYGCNTLKNLEDISKWNTYKATNISYLFIDCISLKKLPDISKWKLNNIKNKECIFSNNVLLYIIAKKIIKEVFSYLSIKYILNIIIYNKKLQNIFGIDIKKYKEVSGIYKIRSRNGKCKEYILNTKILIFEGEYLNGKRNGKGKKYCELEFEGEYLNGKKWNGKGKEYYDNGQLEFEGEYLNGEKNGNGKEYNIDGKLKYEGEYLKGKRNGKGKEYYQNGELEFEGEYLNGKKWNGKGKEYNYNGQLEFEGEYFKGVKKGKGKEFNFFGHLQYEGEYLNGEKNGKGKEIMMVN